MHRVRVEAIRWTDREDYPWLVELRLREADGTVATFVEKEAVVNSDDILGPGTAFPVELEIPCDILERWEDSRSVLVRMHFHISDEHGRDVFHVLESDLG